MKMMKPMSYLAIATTLILVPSLYAEEAPPLEKSQTPETTTPPDQGTLPSPKLSDRHSHLDYSFAKDSRNWKLGYEANNQNMSIKEYVPDNETVDNWTELFTIHSYYNIAVAVDKYYDAFINELQKMVPDNKIDHRIIKKDDHSLLGEWWIQDNSPNAQHEWLRVITDGHDVVVLRYTTRKSGNLESDRKIWEEILSNARLSPPK